MLLQSSVHVHHLDCIPCQGPDLVTWTVILVVEVYLKLVQRQRYLETKSVQSGSLQGRYVNNFPSLLAHMVCSCQCAELCRHALPVMLHLRTAHFCKRPVPNPASVQMGERQCCCA